MEKAIKYGGGHEPGREWRGGGGPDDKYDQNNSYM